MVDEEGSLGRPARGGQIAAARLAEHGAVPEGDLAAVSVSDPEGEVQMVKDGNPEPDPDLRDYENVPLGEDIDAYFAREVTPHVPDAWIDHTKTKIGYEIPFTRHFYVYTPAAPASRDRRGTARPRSPDPEAPGRGDGVNKSPFRWATIACPTIAS